jgi:hypothetical protein
MVFGCDLFNPGTLFSYLGLIQPNLDDILTIEGGGDDDSDPLITAFDDMIIAKLGKKIYVIDESTFTVDEEYDFYFNVGDDSDEQLKVSESASEEVFTYLSSDDDKYILDDDDNVVRKLRVNATGASDVWGDFYAYFSYDGTDTVGLSLYNDETERDEVQFFSVGSDFIQAVAPLKDNTRVMGMEYADETFYIVAAPTVSSDNVDLEEPLEIRLGAFPAADVNEWNDNEDWDWETIEILDLCKFDNNDGGRSYPEFYTSITSEGILLYDLNSPIDEPNVVVLSLDGEIRARYYGPTGHNASGCISANGNFYYFMAETGVYKYSIE